MIGNNPQRKYHSVSLKMYRAQNADIPSTALRLHFYHVLIFHGTNILQNVTHHWVFPKSTKNYHIFY